MKEKKKEGAGGRPRGSRKNIVGSESQGLLQAAAGTGFIGFSAFQTAAKASPTTADVEGGDTAGSTPAGKAGAGSGHGEKRRVKTAKVNGGYSAGSAGQVLPPHYSGSDSHLAVVSKRLSKRDVTTKLKALAELRAMCRLVTREAEPAASPQPGPGQDSRAGTSRASSGVAPASGAGAAESSAMDAPATSAEDLGGLAPHWVFLYQRLSAEGDRRTREAANTTLLCMLKANRRAFQPLMSSLMGPWFCSQADTAPEVSSSAKEAFEAVFPEAKRASVLRRCAEGVLSYIDATVQQTPEMLEEASGCTAEEAVKRAERLSVSAIAALSSFLEAVGPEANSAFSRRPTGHETVAEEEDEDVGRSRQETTYFSLVNESLWARLGDPRTAVRRAMYALVSACCRHAPGLLRPHPPLPPAKASSGDPAEEGKTEAVSDTGGKKEKANRRDGGGVAGKRSRVATPGLLAELLSEKEDSNHREAWQAVLLVLREFKEAWMAEKGAAAVLPTLLTRLRKGAFLATSGTSYPCLLPLLASLPAQALLSPADGRAGPPFCVAFVENLWVTIAKLSSGDAAGDRTGGGGGGGWLADVVSAHVECVTFLLLKLPPASQGLGEAGDTAAASTSGGIPGGGGVVDTEQSSAAVSVAAATANLAKAVGVFVLEEETGATGPGNGVRTVGRRSQTISEAFGRVLGQLHLGGEKGAGVVGTTSGSAAVWGALLREFEGGLDQRSRGGAAWMGKTLVRALTAVNERKSGGARGSPGAAAVAEETVESPSQPPTTARGPNGAGLRELCRTLFHHCVGAIGYVSPSSGATDDEGGAAISSVDAPLTAFMSSMAGALGMDGIFCMGDAALSGDSGGGDSKPSVVAPDSAREFYENFLVPRFVASAGGRQSTEAMGEAAMALESLTKAFLLAEEGPRQSDDFRLLLKRALAEPEAVWLRTTTMVLRLAPASMARVFPEVDEALLRACGISLPGTKPAAAPPSSSSSSTRLHPKCSTQDLPAFLQACLGATDGGRERMAAPFVKASTVSEVVKVATAASLSASTSNSAGTAEAAGAAIRPTLLSMAVLEGLLGVLGTGESGGPADISRGGVGNDDDALAAVRKSGLSLLLAAFSAIGEGRAADRLWRDVAAPTLQDLVLRGPRREAAAAAAAETPPPQWCDGIWQDLVGGAVEEARRAMEGGGVNDDGASDQGAPPLLLPGRGGVERAATLTSALLDLRSALLRRGATLLPPDDAPMLWRLGLTRPSVWRQRRLEALAAGARSTGGGLATAAADLARACVGSRWSRRWECVSLVLARLPDARARLSLLVGGVVSVEAEGGDVGVAGEALHEILAAGVMVSRAVRLLGGEEGRGGVSEVSVDLPSCLLVGPAEDTISVSGRMARAAAGGVDSVEDFGVGLARFRGVSMAVDGDDSGAVAAVASAEVLDAALAHLGEQSQGAFEAKAGGAAAAAAAAAAADGYGVASKQPFSLLLPQGLWRVAFESAAPDTKDERLHAVLLSALSSCLAFVAQDAAALAGGGGGGEAGAVAWRTACSATVSSGLVVAVVGEAFARGLGLGDEANRLMAVRCGTYKAPVPSAADLVPGAKTLYTSDGQAVTIVAAHVDPGGGEAYYTVRPIPAPGGTADDAGRERQTVLGRLSVTPPSPRSSGAVAAPPPHARWLVRPAVAAKLGEVLAGPVSAIERRLWEHLGRSPEMSGPEAPALSSATAAALRGVASTCVRAALLCGSNPRGTAGGGSQEAWEGVRPGILTLRNRWAAAAAKSGSAVLASKTGGGGGGGGTVQAAATVALAASVLSGFLAATPLMPSDEEGMRLMPARIRGSLCGEAAGGAGSAAAALGWRRVQGTASLAWLRDCAEASCKVHVSASLGSLGSDIFVGTQAETEAAVVALVRSAGRRRRGDNSVVGGGSFDLALARACAGLFAAESCRLSQGHAASLSCDSKAAVVSWAVSKFLLSGGRMASATAARGALVNSFGGGDDDAAALCLETARLLTATAWDGRVGWGGGAVAAAGGATSPPPLHRLLAARGDRAKVWEAARSPAVWRGLHAAVVGAVASPVLQLCAFEVLEAAAADWRSDPVSGDEGSEGAKGDDAGTPAEEEESKDNGSSATAPGEGQSIVSRLARALGGWGLASAQAGGGAVGGVVDVEGSDGGGDADEGAGSSSPGTEAVEEEAKEQQDDLELIAKCFPEDLLLAVEALPSTIDALAEAPQASARARSGARREDDIMAAHEEEEEGDYDDSEAEEEDVEDEKQAWDSEEGADVDSAERPTGDASAEEEEEEEEEEDGSESGDAEEEHSADSEPEQGGGTRRAEETDGDIAPQSTASKSRRKRLRRRLSSSSGTTRTTTSDRGQAGNIPGGGRDRRRTPASGPSLTGPFLTWLLWLEHCRRASELEVKSRSAARAFVARAGALAPVMEACFRVLRASQDEGGRGSSGSIGGASRLGPAQAVRVSRLDPRKPHDLARLALAVYFRTVHVFPALSRSWWSDDCARGLRVWVADFTKRHVSPALIQIEAQIITRATDKGVWDDGGEMSVRASANSRQVVASYLKEECTLEAVIQLPPDYPLRNVEVTCSKRMGVSESRWRQWVLQIVTLLSLQDGSVLDAVMMWKKNVDKEFEGVEPCVICYSVLHPKSMDLPQMTCKTCNNRFHSSCLYKWFHTSHKNKCPICQQTWA